MAYYRLQDLSSQTFLKWKIEDIFGAQGSYRSVGYNHLQ